MLRIALDATPLTLTSGGLRRYVEQLSLALSRAYPEDRYTLISDQTFVAPEGLSSRIVGSGRYWSWGIRGALRELEADVFHGTNFEVPYLPGTPSVLTIHDLSPWKNPEWHGGADRVRRRTPWLVRLRRAKRILTVSEVMAREIAEYFGISSEWIRAVPLAPLPHGRGSVERRGLVERSGLVELAGLGRPYFLFVGTLEPRKNLHGLVEAWRSLHGAIDLVIAGRTRSDFVPLPTFPGLTIMGEVPDDALPDLYSHATAFVFPTHYEGFGLPVLEAMQYGCPVIASRDPAVMEVSGGAALHVADFGTAMREIVDNPELQARLSEDGRKRAAEFTWEKTARRTHEVYEEIA